MANSVNIVLSTNMVNFGPTMFFRMQAIPKNRKHVLTTKIC
jgi:hypothetical protein